MLCAGRPPVAFDVLSLNTGSAPGVRRVAGAEGSVVPVKPIDGFFARWTELRARVAGTSGPVSIGIVGGGAGGVELALSIRYGLARAAKAAGRPSDNMRIELFTDSSEILPAYPRRMRTLFARILADDGIVVHTDHRVVRVDGPRLHFGNGSSATFDELLWVTTAGARTGRGNPVWMWTSAVSSGCATPCRPCPIPMSSPPETSPRSKGTRVPRQASSRFARARRSPRNLERRLRGASLAGFRPQREYLSLISTGRRHAVAARNGLTVAGRWVWTWKDRIDRRFIRDYTELPAMDGEGVDDGPVPGGVSKAGLRGDGRQVASSGRGPAMRCGGCGSKVGSELLFRSLARLGAKDDPRVMVGLDAPTTRRWSRFPRGRSPCRASTSSACLSRTPSSLAASAPITRLAMCSPWGPSRWRRWRW